MIPGPSMARMEQRASRFLCTALALASWGMGLLLHFQATCYLLFPLDCILFFFCHTLLLRPLLRSGSSLSYRDMQLVNVEGRTAQGSAAWLVGK